MKGIYFIVFCSLQQKYNLTANCQGDFTGRSFLPSLDSNGYSEATARSSSVADQNKGRLSAGFPKPETRTSNYLFVFSYCFTKGTTTVSVATTNFKAYNPTGSWLISIGRLLSPSNDATGKFITTLPVASNTCT